MQEQQHAHYDGLPLGSSRPDGCVVSVGVGDSRFKIRFVAGVAKFGCESLSFRQLRNECESQNLRNPMNCVNGQWAPLSERKIQHFVVTCFYYKQGEKCTVFKIVLVSPPPFFSVSEAD
jgi:hypothetical protein